MAANKQASDAKLKKKRVTKKKPTLSVWDQAARLYALERKGYKAIRGNREAGQLSQTVNRHTAHLQAPALCDSDLPHNTYAYVAETRRLLKLTRRLVVLTSVLTLVVFMAQLYQLIQMNMRH